MPLTILSIAYPFARVRPDTAGGAEQVLGHLDAALVRAGHRSIVIASEGSRTSGQLLAIPHAAGTLGPHSINEAHEQCRRAICRVLQECHVDVVHMHGVDFHAYLPPPGPPVLVTLHLPLQFYPAAALEPNRPDTWLHCVSAIQQAGLTPCDRLLRPIENGVLVHEFAPRHARRGFALMLSRICPEKGVHIAIRAAKRANASLLIAGEVFPHAEHQRYFTQEVLPHIDNRRRFIGPIGPARKRRLLAAARCLLVPSLVPETSSLVAREALTVGTPVIAFARGALAEIIEDGETGFLVDDEEELAQAIHRADAIDPKVCRESARERFPLERMIDRYFTTYAMLAGASARSEMDAA